MPRHFGIPLRQPRPQPRRYSPELGMAVAVALGAAFVIAAGDVIASLLPW